MKVVLFCGGYGMRMRDGVSDLPKPMVPIGDRPLLWHVMRYYAYYGHTDFVLALGYGAHHIKRYFLDYREADSNDFVLTGDGSVELLSRDISDWRITFVDTGRETPIGERLRRVAPHLAGEPMFMANYADVLSDVPLDDMVDKLSRDDAAGIILTAPPQQAFHMAEVDGDHVMDITPVRKLPIRMNGGYFVFRSEILDEIREGEDLVEGAVSRLARRQRMLNYPYDGFWVPADTVKERSQLESMYQTGNRPWAKWERR